MSASAIKGRPGRKGLAWIAAVALAGVTATRAAASSDVLPLKSAAPAGVGPLALPNLGQHVLGTAFVYGSAQPDLFIAGQGGPRGLYLCRWLRSDGNDVPVFAPPVRVKSAFSEKGALVQTADGTIHAGWIDAGQIVHTVFDRAMLAWSEVGRLAIVGLPRAPQGLALLPNPDGTWTVIFEVADGTVGKNGNAWSETWRPYDAAGIWTGGFPYRYLYTATLPRLLEGPMRDMRPASATQREVYFGMNQIAPVNLGAGHTRDVITGSRQGVLAYYHNRADSGIDLTERQLAAGEDGNTLRHPSIAAGVVAFSAGTQGVSNLIVGGEGAPAYYAFARRFTADGRPVFKGPTAVLQEGADLYAGSLPVPSVVDWNGDGVPDLVVGNSEGRVLFFENIGSDVAPRFLPGVAIAAGGPEIHVQAGYAGSVQGVQEARWGYVSPNVVDWNGDGLPDIVMGDITGNLTVYLNRGTKRAPALEAAHPIYCDGLDLHGMWRVRPAVARVGDRNVLALVDGDDHFHLYRQIDDYNVEDRGKLKLKDGSPIGASSGPGGLTGRCKLDFFDWDQDGVFDLVINTCRSNAIPNRETGFPRPTLGASPLATVLFMKNVGTNASPVFEHPVPFVHATMGVVQAGGAHESGAVATMLGGDGPNLLVGNESGRLFLLRGHSLSARKEDWPVSR